MQPLPPDLIATSFNQAATLLGSAAGRLGSVESADDLRLGAQKLASGIPSLRLQLGREQAGPITAALESAAQGARDLSKVIAAGPGERPPEELAAVQAWQELAGSAAALVSAPSA